MKLSKTYTAVLMQAGPVAPQELFVSTDFIDPFVWTRVAEGEYKGRCADPFIKIRSHILCTASADGSILLAGAIIVSDNEIRLYCNNEAAVNTINLRVEYFL